MSDRSISLCVREQMVLSVGFEPISVQSASGLPSLQSGFTFDRHELFRPLSRGFERSFVICAYSSYDDPVRETVMQNPLFGYVERTVGIMSFSVADGYPSAVFSGDQQ